ncbi:molecular chaperone Hsp90 [Muricomes intestini]|jgi:hypothetical protein|uniref:Molecular chaperone Hsp90 n=1 Tax=Muricomes intestini TaxID=1796634 RepID=A0A4R3K990_9FIRM|nr:molecular chaperone Hsp90 [Muricomes intestini]TCS79517.1 hypothetical protein EDD59_108103 [Muricomes intestini]HAX53468.1 molecular chaperone Hsp90 [Lachnospiraceae bacterium]HCR84134.1 molecular chaperone Hsp90 [Lachnospiraceae bacterium]
MEKEVLDYAVEKTHDLMSAPSCSAEAKAAAQIWLDAIGTGEEAAETKKYIQELEEDVTPIDGLIGLAESEDGIQIFGAENAKNMAAHAKEIKTAGAQHCDCAACTAAAEILEKKDALLK